MSPIQIALLVLAVAGVWAIVELALTLRKTRTVVDCIVMACAGQICAHFWQPTQSARCSFG